MQQCTKMHFMGRMIVTVDLDDEVYEFARAKARSEMVSTETWIGFIFEQFLNRRRGARHSSPAPEPQPEADEAQE